VSQTSDPHSAEVKEVTIVVTAGLLAPFIINGKDLRHQFSVGCSGSSDEIA